jgi:hypothetical protein
MTTEEYQRLCEAAGSRTISDYIRRQLLGNNVAPRQARRRPVEGDEILSIVLSELGRSRLSSNLNQLAKAVARSKSFSPVLLRWFLLCQ